MGIGHQEAVSIMERVLELSKADETEILLSTRRSSLTRFANSIIHQNVATRDASVSVRVVLGKRIGVAEVNRLDSGALEEVLHRAEAIARVQRPNEDFKALPPGGKIHPVKSFSEATARSSPEERARVVGGIVALAQEANVKVFGALATTTQSLGVMNSRGAEAFDQTTQARVTVSAIAEDGGKKGYGWGEDANVDVGELATEEEARAAIHKARDGLGARALEPKEYAVVLEPTAVSDLVATLGFTTFGAMAYQEGRSYLTGKLGQSILPGALHLYDDGLAPGGFPMAFDFEGVPKRRVELVQDGIARGVVYDSYTAGREPGKESTGHALPAPNPFGPIPMNLFLGPGDASIEEMVRETRLGVYVTRFHYTNTIDATKTLWTGMTRDGTFLIEDGEVRGAVANLRFSNSIVDCLGSVAMVGRRPKAYPLPDWFPAGGTAVPALKLDRFRFTGTTS